MESIHLYLRQKKEDIHAGRIPIEQYIITKALTKAPEDYPESGKGQPHVQVALKLRQAVSNCELELLSPVGQGRSDWRCNSIRDLQRR